MNTNACNAYFPTKTEYSKGGYEVLYSILLYYKYHGRALPLAGESADKLCDIICEEWEKIEKTI
jgi:hypothetical protein